MGLFCTRIITMTGKEYSEKNGKKLSAEQIKEVGDAFDMFADDGGNIKNQRLKKAMKEIGMDCSDEELHDMISEVDEGGSGEIDFDEFLTMMIHCLGLDDPDDAKDAFKTMDANKNGKVLISDMQDVLKGMREKLSSDEMNDVLNELDPKKTGSFDLATFKKVFPFP